MSAILEVKRYKIRISIYLHIPKILWHVDPTKERFFLRSPRRCLQSNKSELRNSGVIGKLCSLCGRCDSYVT
jgi:hypothetical protein